MQFHPEVDQSIVANWASWERETKPCADKFLADFSLKEKIYLEVSHRLLGNFLRLAGFTARKKGGAGLEKP
jgi:hypothetical protein